MTKKALVLFAVAGLVVTAAVPLMAQTIRLTANIPFEFTVGTKTMPAGEYYVSNGASPTVLMLNSYAARAAALTEVQMEPVNSQNPAADTKLVFTRYGNRYFLSEVVNGYVAAGFRLPETKAERELAKTASVEREEVLVVLARR